MTIRSLLAAIPFVWLTACGYDAPPAPTRTPTPAPSNAPASIRIDISSQSAQDAVTAVVLTVDGRGVSGIPVQFFIGAGSITPAGGTSDVTGSVHAVATSPTNTTITATAPSVSLTASFNILATTTH